MARRNEQSLQSDSIMKNPFDITILCKVVDNFGDIGVVYRLAKSILNLSQNPQFAKTKIRLIVDDLTAFNKINDKIDDKKSFQCVNGMEIYDWKDFDFCYNEFTKNPPVVILECFQCGRPDWLEKILFDDKVRHIVNIIMIDYLTAEDYAETFHCLQSLTRSARVQKVNFMPGFTEKTGGLILDNMENLLQKKVEKKQILFFSYDRDWSFLTSALERFYNENGFKKLFVAQGKGKESFCKAYKDEKCNFFVEELPFINQEEWDALLVDCSILFIRGEESLSRAALSGIPFVWHAYPQSDEYQLVKVNALLEKLRPFFSESDFEIIKKVWIDFNSPDSELDKVQTQQNVLEFLKNVENLKDGFENFGQNLRKNGDLAFNLMTFIKQIVIIEDN